jgi:hypothetical protein
MCVLSMIIMVGVSVLVLVLYVLIDRYARVITVNAVVFVYRSVPVYFTLHSSYTTLSLIVEHTF